MKLASHQYKKDFKKGYMEKSILVVEDDLNMGFLLVDFLQDENFKVKLCKDGLSGLKTAEKGYFDLCIFDIMMPKMDGISLAKTLRNKGYETPFIFLTAKSLIEDKIKGYEVGAEDYISKPFDVEELLCKINVILRRTAKKPTPKLAQEFNIGEYAFCYERQELTYQGITERLTQKESEVLKLLCLHKNKILKREEAVFQIYGKKDYFLGRSFDVFISKLRKRLKKDSNVKIENVFKVGFILSVKE